MILCVGTTPAVQRVMLFPKLTPGAVNRARETREGLGGKALNVARALTQLGEEALALGFAGGERGRWLLEELKRQGVPAQFVEVASQTRLCTTLIDETSGEITELVEESGAATAENFDALRDLIIEMLSGSGALVLSGTLAPGGTPDFYGQCAAAAQNAGRLCVVDASGPALAHALQFHPGVVKPNRAELQKTLGAPVETEAQVWQAMSALLSKGAGAVVVTDGPDRVFVTDGRMRCKIAPPQVKLVNPIGSGDSFTAALAAWLLRGESLPEACRAGAAAGAANAMTLMPGTLVRGDFDALLEVVRLDPC